MHLLEAMETLPGETFSMAVQKQFVAKWLSCYLDTLSVEELKLIHVEDTDSVFKFGDGKLIYSKKRITFPTIIAGKDVFLRTDVVSNDLPLLLSKEAMKKANTQIDFASEKVNILGCDV